MQLSIEAAVNSGDVRLRTPNERRITTTLRMQLEGNVFFLPAGTRTLRRAIAILGNHDIGFGVGGPIAAMPAAASRRAKSGM